MTSIEAVLRQYPADCRPIQIEPLGSAGGMSGAQFWRITTPCGTLALRRWPTEHPSPQDLGFIHSVLAHAAGRGVDFLPVPISTRNGQSFVEHASQLYELAPWLPGEADSARSSSVEKLQAAMSALAQFHVATADFRVDKLATTTQAPGPAPSVTRRLVRLRKLTSGGIEQLSRAIDDATWPELAPLARRFTAALPRAVPPTIAKLEPLANVPLPLQPCIRDIWHDHVLFIGNRVTGLIDFGAVAIDTPATDIARLLGSLNDSTRRHGDGPAEKHFAFDVWQQGLTAYSAIRPLSDTELLAVTAFDATAPILAGCNWIRWIYADRREFENRAQVYERFHRIVTRAATAS